MIRPSINQSTSMVVKVGGTYRLVDRGLEKLGSRRLRVVELSWAGRVAAQIDRSMSRVKVGLGDERRGFERLERKKKKKRGDDFRNI